jgi:hypothetical protein
VEGFLKECANRYANVEVWMGSARLGPNKGQELHFPRVVDRFPDAPYYVMCDDDVIYHPGWLQRLIRVYEEARAIGLVGIFTALSMARRPAQRSVVLPTSEVLLKERQPALNWLLPREVYEAVGPFRDVGIAFDHDYWNRAQALGFSAICLKPSYVQNIGYKGAYQCDDSHTADDYVGKKDLYLRCQDFWYSFKRQTAGLARTVIDQVPDGRLKRSGRRVGGTLRSWLRGDGGRGQ